MNFNKLVAEMIEKKVAQGLTVDAAIAELAGELKASLAIETIILSVIGMALGCFVGKKLAENMSFTRYEEPKSCCCDTLDR